jgi:hypothetical protein
VLAVVDEIDDAEPFQRGRSIPAQKIADVACVAAHRQRREVLAGSAPGGRRRTRGWSPAERDPVRIVRNLNPSDSGRFVAYNTALMLATLRTIRLVRNDCTQGLG